MKTITIKIVVILLCVTLLAACNTKIGDNGRVEKVVTSADLQQFSFESISGIDASGISNLLNKALTEFKGENVYFRVAIQCEGVKYNDIMAFAKSIGAKNIANLGSSSEYTFSGAYTEMELNANMIQNISARGGVKIYLALPGRGDEYEPTISDALARKLLIMNDEDTVEVVVRTKVDGSGMYLLNQNIPYNENFNKELQEFWSGASPVDMARFVSGKGYTAEKYNEKIEKYVDAILERNSIVEKRVNSDELMELGISGLNENYFISIESLTDATASYKSDTVAAFNAKLTKAEILRVSEDIDIRAIFLVELDEISDDYCEPANSLYKNHK